MEQAKRQKAKLFSFRYFFYDFIKITGALPGLIWLRPKWIYETPTAKKRLRNGCIVISNHYSFFDPVYLMYAIWYRRHHFICGKEFFESKYKKWFQAFLCIPIDRENFRMDSLRQITDELKSGSLITLFPEGHINDGSGQLAGFKSGMVLMALQGKAPIVPVYFKPKEHFYNRLRVAIGEPLDIISRYGSRPTFSQIEQIASELQAKEEALKTLVNKRR